MKKTIAIIPSRYQSSRFPGKPLADIGGKPMVQRVYEQVLKASRVDEVCVATDDERIASVVRGFGGNVAMTSSEHPTGTDRCYEASLQFEADIVVNVQGDEPFIKPEQIDQLVQLFADDNITIGTLVKVIKEFSTLIDPNVPKVVMSDVGSVLYFSRFPIPYMRGEEKSNWMDKHTYYKHIGMYGYRRNTLKKLTGLGQTDLEKAESLEQLRWLQNGFKVHAVITEYESFGIDTPDQLEVIKTRFLDSSEEL
jgi:3-deoxy-manno-octulosonate cytidylyltransferase (CMP-KDO synthetase)